MSQPSPLQQQNEELKSALSLLTATLDSTADGILVVGTDSKISVFNQRFLEMWCIPREMVLLRDDRAALAFVAEQLRDPEPFLARVAELYALPEEESLDILELKDGRTLERYSCPHYLGGRPAGRVWSFRDVTERQLAIDRLLHSSCHDELREADRALHRAKTSGRARYPVPNRVMHRRTTARRRLEADLEHAFENDQFRIYYQPFVDLMTEEVAGFEALLRWHHPRYGLRVPADFLAVAEQMGLLVPIGRFMLLESCRQIRALQARFPRRPPLQVTVNLSHGQFFHDDLFDQVEDALTRSGLDPACLGLEITEGVVIDHPESATRRFARLKALGVQLFLDDFGKGYSSLSYLHQFPMEILKIDRSFTAQIGDVERNFPIVRAIVTLARQLRMKVVAEGIETAEQLESLRELGCEYGQGYRFSRPIPAEGLEDLLAASGAQVGAQACA